MNTKFNKAKHLGTLTTTGGPLLLSQGVPRGWMGSDEGGQYWTLLDVLHQDAESSVVKFENCFAFANEQSIVKVFETDIGLAFVESYVGSVDVNQLLSSIEVEARDIGLVGNDEQISVFDASLTEEDISLVGKRAGFYCSRIAREMHESGRCDVWLSLVFHGFSIVKELRLRSLLKSGGNFGHAMLIAPRS